MYAFYVEVEFIRKLLDFRLTKYPLLFDNLAKYSKHNPEEEKNVRRALKRSKEILNRIDEAVREAADIDQISEIMRKLDMSAYEKSDPQMAAEFKVSFSLVRVLTVEKFSHELQSPSVR